MAQWVIFPKYVGGYPRSQLNLMIFHKFLQLSPWTTPSPETEWTSNTGASNYMTGKPCMLNIICKYFGTNYVLIGDGSSLPILGIIDSYVKQKNIALPLCDVLLVPDLTKNLLSVSQLAT